jgi:hypothetical protein
MLRRMSLLMCRFLGRRSLCFERFALNGFRRLPASEKRQGTKSRWQGLSYTQRELLMLYRDTDDQQRLLMVIPHSPRHVTSNKVASSPRTETGFDIVQLLSGSPYLLSSIGIVPSASSAEQEIRIDGGSVRKDDRNTLPQSIEIALGEG